MVRIYKQSQRNGTYPFPNTTFVIPQRSESYTQTQRNIVCDVSVGEHTLASYVLYQITRNYVNIDINNNNYSQ